MIVDLAIHVSDLAIHVTDLPEADGTPAPGHRPASNAR